MSVRRLIRKGDLSLRFGTTTLTIPIGGGSVSKTFCVDGFAIIEFIVNTRIVNTNPKTEKIYAPQCWLVTGTSIVGISAGGVTGTTVTVEGAYLGY